MKRLTGDGPRYFDFKVYLKEGEVTRGAGQPDMTLQDYKNLIQNYKDARPIFVSTEMKFGEQVEARDMIRDGELFSMPFPCCWFEMISKEGRNISVHMDLKTYETQINAVLIKEINPMRYEIATFFEVFTKVPRRAQHLCLVEDTHDILFFLKSWPILDGFMKKVIDSLKGGRLISEQVNRVTHVPMPERLGKTKVKEISQIIHVVPKKSKKEDVVPIFRGTIDWSHRWEVMGHWRRVSGIGKDRNGVHCLPGLTWVREHEKGPEEAVLVKKMRVIDDE